MKNEFVENIDYKLTLGSSNKLLLIFTGVGGSVSGYQNKYEKIATDMKDYFDISTLVISLPSETFAHREEIFDFAISKIKTLFECRKVDDYEIYVMGSSAGGTITLEYFQKFAKITKICAINPVFSVNFDRILKNLENSDIKKAIILGELDMSISTYKLLQEIKDVETVVIPNGDHYLSGDKNFEYFLNIPRKFFIDS